MKERLAVAGILVFIAIAIFVVLIRNDGASSTANRRTAMPQPGRAAEIATVNLRSLQGRRPLNEGAARDPFAFSHRPRAVSSLSTKAMTYESTRSYALPSPVPPPQTPVLPVRFVGTVHKQDLTWAVFSDCAGYIRATAEGEHVLGRWRLIAIGLESVTVESVDGREITVRMTGCQPR